MFDAVTSVPVPANEPVKSYASGSAERAWLETKIKELVGEQVDLTMTVGGVQRMGGGDWIDIVQPHNHAHVLGRLGDATDEDVAAAVDAASLAAPGWRELSFDDRAAIFLRAAELLAGPWRSVINASTMLGQSKSVYQAEIDAACGADRLLAVQRGIRQAAARRACSLGARLSEPAQYRPLGGFVLAITPFNFTSICRQPPTAPVLMGNTAVFKPATQSLLVAHFLMELWAEAGLPPGVINMVTGGGRAVSRVALSHRDLAGIHFTGSTGTFQHLWRTVGENISGYRSYPRLVGETGGKDFVIAHPSADPEVLRTALVRGAFEYQGQKCSAIPGVRPAACGAGWAMTIATVRTLTLGTSPPTCPRSWVPSSTTRPSRPRRYH